MRESKTPKGALKESKLRNKRRQNLFDAIKKMRSEGSAWINIDNHRVKIVSFEDNDFAPGSNSQHVLAKHNGRIRLCLLVESDGWTIHSHDFQKRFRRVTPGSPDVLALVDEMY